MNECVTGIYFSYEMRTLKSMKMKFTGVKQLCIMHLCTKFRGSTLSRFAEILAESCQNVSALPTDKPYCFLKCDDNIADKYFISIITVSFRNDL